MHCLIIVSNNITTTAGVIRTALKKFIFPSPAFYVTWGVQISIGGNVNLYVAGHAECWLDVHLNLSNVRPLAFYRPYAVKLTRYSSYHITQVLFVFIIRRCGSRMWLRGWGSGSVRIQQGAAHSRTPVAARPHRTHTRHAAVQLRLLVISYPYNNFKQIWVYSNTAIATTIVKSSEYVDVTLRKLVYTMVNLQANQDSPYPIKYASEGATLAM